MADIDAVAEAVKSFAEQFKSVIALADAVKGMGSVDNAIKERKDALVKASAEHDAALKNIEAIKNQGTVLKAEQEAASKIHDKALNDMNDKTKADAAAEATKIISAATAKVKVLEDDMAKAQKDHADKMADGNKGLVALRDELAFYQNQLKLAKVEMESMAARMNDIKKAAQHIAA